MRSTVLFFSAALAAVTAASQAARAELVLNPGFEIGDTSGAPIAPAYWDTSGNVAEDSANPNSGTNDAFVGTGSLSQVITTVPGTIYTVSFYADINDFNLLFDASATLTATFGGTDLLNGLSAAPDLFGDANYVQFSTQVAATDTSTTLAFTGVTNPGDGVFYIDDVSVEAPEPASMAILASAVTGLWLVRRRVA